MKRLLTVSLVGLCLLMVATNPNGDRYADYGVAQLQNSQDSICPSNIPILGTTVENECKSFISSNSGAIKQVISKTTNRYNLLLFSIYKTDLSIDNLIQSLPANIAPGYRFESIGIFGQFFTYQAERK